MNEDRKRVHNNFRLTRVLSRVHTFYISEWMRRTSGKRKKKKVRGWKRRRGERRTERKMKRSGCKWLEGEEEVHTIQDQEKTENMLSSSRRRKRGKEARGKRIWYKRRQRQWTAGGGGGGMGWKRERKAKGNGEKKKARKPSLIRNWMIFNLQSTSSLLYNCIPNLSR